VKRNFYSDLNSNFIPSARENKQIMTNFIIFLHNFPITQIEFLIKSLVFTAPQVRCLFSTAGAEKVDRKEEERKKNSIVIHCWD
jgi:RNA recognition motif-containing protein